MSEKFKCILCEKDARETKLSGKGADLVKCETCGNYELDRMFKGIYASWPREKRRMLSAHTRNLFELGEEPPELKNAGLWEKIIAEYEYKTNDEKLENLIWYLRKKSKEYGDSISWDEKKDYPITFSLSPNGFMEIIKNARKNDLLDEPARGTVKKLSDDGWKLGTELLKNKKKS